MPVTALADRACTGGADIVVVTIFVNPIQFDRKEDYERYAKNLDSRPGVLRGPRSGSRIRAAVEEMYPEPLATFVDDS